MFFLPFKYLAMMYLCVSLFILILLWVHWASWLCIDRCFSSNSKSFKPLFFKFFSVLFSPLLLECSSNAYLCAWCYLTDFWGSLAFYFNLFSVFFRYYNFHWSIFKFTDFLPFSNLKNLLSVSSRKFLFSVIAFFISRISIWFILYNFCLLSENTCLLIHCFHTSLNV